MREEGLYVRRFAGVISYGLTFFVVGRVLAGRVNGRMCCRSARVTEPSKTAFLRPLDRRGLHDGQIECPTFLFRRILFLSLLMFMR